MILVDESKKVSASDSDRCWYGNGLVNFRAIVSQNNTQSNLYFIASGGHNITYDQNDCSPEAVAKISLHPDNQIYREKLLNEQYNQNENLYKLTILAQGYQM